MENQDKFRVGHIIKACQDIESFVKKREDLYDLKTELAVVRCYEIIGEAAKNLSDALYEELSEIPWRDIIDMRNKVIHEYFRVEQDILFYAAIREIPELRKTLEAWLEKQS